MQIEVLDAGAQLGVDLVHAISSPSCAQTRPPASSRLRRCGGANGAVGGTICDGLVRSNWRLYTFLSTSIVYKGFSSCQYCKLLAVRLAQGIPAFCRARSMPVLGIHRPELTAESLAVTAASPPSRGQRLKRLSHHETEVFGRLSFGGQARAVTRVSDRLLGVRQTQVRARRGSEIFGGPRSRRAEEDLSHEGRRGLPPDRDRHQRGRHRGVRQGRGGHGLRPRGGVRPRARRHPPERRLEGVHVQGHVPRAPRPVRVPRRDHAPPGARHRDPRAPPAPDGARGQAGRGGGRAERQAALAEASLV